MAARNGEEKDVLLRTLRSALADIGDAARRGLAHDDRGAGNLALAEIAATATAAQAGIDTVLQKSNDPQPSHDLPPLCVLVVDDGAASRRVVASMLVAAGHKAVEAVDGCDAMRVLLDFPCDVILLDMHMPGMDGAATTQAIRTSNTRRVDSHVPIVGMTSGEALGDARADGAACDAWLGKPPSSGALHVALYHALTARGRLEPLLAARGRARPTTSTTKNDISAQKNKDSNLLRPLAAMRAEYSLGPAEVANLYAILVADLPLRLDALALAAEEGLDGDVADLAHAMAGSALGIATEHVSPLARRVEAAARDGNRTVYAPAAAELVREVRAVVRAMREALEKARAAGGLDG